MENLKTIEVIQMSEALLGELMSEIKKLEQIVSDIKQLRQSGR